MASKASPPLSNMVAFRVGGSDAPYRKSLRHRWGRTREQRALWRAMRRAGAFGGSTPLWVLLVARVAAAFEPVSVTIAIGAVSALTGYLYNTDLYCRFTECCHEERPLNASGTCGRAGGRASGVQPEAAPRDMDSARTSPHLRRPGDDRPENGSQRGRPVCAPSSGCRACGSVQKARLWLLLFCFCFPSQPGVAGKLARSSAARWLFPG